MIQMRTLRKGAISTLIASLLTFALAGAISFAHAEALRPEIANPLLAAQKLTKDKKYSEAMAKVRDAEAVGNKTAGESAAIEQMKSYVASLSGDTSTMIKSYENQIESNRLTGADKLRVMQSLASLYFQAKDYSKASIWVQRYIKEGGNDPQTRDLSLQIAAQNNDCQSVERQLQAEVSAGGALTENKLLLLVNCAERQKDNAGYLAAMQKLVTYYPKKEYWAGLLSRLERKPGFSSRLALDVYRLKFITGNVSTKAEYMDMTQLALVDGQNAEAEKIINQGYATGVLGTGDDVERQNRLKALVIKKTTVEHASTAQREAEALADADGTNLFNYGYDYVVEGNSDMGLSFMEQALKKNLRYPDHAKLHLGIAYMLAGQKAKAAPVLKTVGGTDGAADLAKLWLVVRPVAVEEVKKTDKADNKNIKNKKK